MTRLTVSERLSQRTGWFTIVTSDPTSEPSALARKGESREAEAETAGDADTAPDLRIDPAASPELVGDAQPGARLSIAV